jgi:uncharacterized protein YbjT (DUF2867 family)
MNKRQQPTTLVLGATGKTGSRVAAELVNRGMPVRRAARSGVDVDFEWTDRDTYVRALDAVDRVYLVAPILRTDFADDVSTFLGEAEAAGVQHVTFLSAYGMDQASAQEAARSVELDLARRQRLGHTILRPAWFMQNFSETFLMPIEGAIVVPTGDGSEAFIDVADIGAVAASTLADPARHAGNAYNLTGPEALTLSEAAEIISEAAGREIVHIDLDRDAWVAGAIANGVPAEYGKVLRQLTEAIAQGKGSQPNDTVQQITGAPARNFRGFAYRSAAAWKEVST